MPAAAKLEHLPDRCSESVLTSIVLQEAQKDAASAFDDFMDQCIQSDWARDREKLVHTIMPVGGTAKSHPNRQASLTATSNTLFLEAATGLFFCINF